MPPNAFGEQEYASTARIGVVGVGATESGIVQEAAPIGLRVRVGQSFL
jgi:hypothetical protein